MFLYPYALLHMALGASRGETERRRERGGWGWGGGGIAKQTRKMQREGKRRFRKGKKERSERKR